MTGRERRQRVRINRGIGKNIYRSFLIAALLLLLALLPAAARGAAGASDPAPAISPPKNIGVIMMDPSRSRDVASNDRRMTRSIF
jgi:hypothetical protein